MQDGSWNHPLPFSLLLKDSAAGGALEGDGGVFSEASSDGELYLDTVAELDSGDGDFADLTAFLSAEEINHSLDLAREAFGDPYACEDPGASNPTPQEQALQPMPPPAVNTQTTENLTTSSIVQHQTKAPVPDDNGAGRVSSGQNTVLIKPVQVSSEAPSSAEKVVRHKPIQTLYKQDKPRLVHADLELNDRVSSATEFCSRAATFIEELSSIFKGSAHLEQQMEDDSSSPDSGYLSPRSQRPAPQGSVSAPPLPPVQQEQTQCNQTDTGPQPGGLVGVTAAAGYQHSGAPTTTGPLSPPQFLQKLKSQEVAEGSPIRLECRVTGNPLPLVRHYPKTNFTSVADTPENLRLKQQTKMQSQVRYREDFEKNRGRCFSSVADTPEILRVKKLQENISNIKYHEDFEKAKVGKDAPQPQSGHSPAAFQSSAGSQNNYDAASESVGQAAGGPASSSGKRYRAVYDYAAADEDEVSFVDGDVIMDVHQIDEGWMYGRVERTGQQGMLPANYVEAI